MHSTLMRWMRAAGILIMLLGLFGCTGVPVREEEQQPPYQEIQDCIEAGNPECALRKYRDYLKTFPDAAIDRLLIARLLVAADRPEEAREELELLIAESGPTVETLLTLGHLERLAGEPDRERQALERALEIEEGNARVLAALGTLQVEAGEHDRARQSFDKALEADPREPTALRGLAVSCLEQQRYQEAVDYFDRAVDADPGNPLNYSDRARGRAALKDRQGAVQDLSTAIAMDPGFYWNYIDRGRHYLALRRWAEAEGDLSRAIRIDAEIFLAYVYRAGLYDRMERTEEAISDYTRVLELNPEYIFAHAPLGMLHYLEGNWGPAAEAFREAYIHEPAESSYALLAALSWLQYGEEGKAREYLGEQAGGFPPGSWAETIARYFLDPALESRTVQAANKEQNELDRARMLFFIAARLLMEERIETALRYLLLVREVDRRDLPEQRIAGFLLSRFDYRE